MAKRTHREAKTPQISARFLADFMAAGQRERARRTIIQNCKFRAVARIIQHDEAKAIISNYVRSGARAPHLLEERAASIRNKLFDDDFEQTVLEHNAEYVSRFAKICGKLTLPDAEILAPPKIAAMNLKGVRITTEVHLGFRRTTRNNTTRFGAGALRYSKGKALSADVALWQSALLFAILKTQNTSVDEAEQKLCLTIDAYSGDVYAAPTDSLTRFKEMEAACETIAERWPNITPPKNAVLED